MALCTLDSLLGCLEVRAVGEGRWSAPNLDLAYHRVFGGQLLAQAIAAAAATGDGKVVKSISCRFPREGSTETTFELDVTRVQDGRTFSTRAISASQQGRTFFSALVSLHTIEDGPAHQLPVERLGQAPGAGPDDAEPVELGMIPWETRAVGGVDLGDAAAADPSYGFWSRVGDRRLPDEPHVHQALLAHATDLTLIGTSLRAHDGLSQADSGTRLATAVTSHDVWFHRPFRMDEWCLLTQQSPVTAGARGFGQGHVLTEDGTLVASFAQESLIRPL